MHAVRPLALAALFVLLLPGVAAAVSRCTMADCGPSGAEAAASAGDACCCRQALQWKAPCCDGAEAAPAVPTAPVEPRMAPAASAAHTATIAFAPSPAAFSLPGLPPTPSPAGFEPLAQGCILRI